MTISETLGKYPAVFHEAHMPLELGISAPDGSDTPAMDGFVTFCSFIIFGSVPMFTYVILFGANVTNQRTVFGVACAMTALTLFSLGFVQAVITGQPRIKTGSLMTINGGLAAAAAYLIGWGLENAIPKEE